ncbi:hypothetical protein [Metabacillus fastidiosus]|uniref:hypothetical protein n=1 Tax=Metabacillus fastidiosus TaxID=1458 RepID=UPI002E1B997D|nr:hypothetical protein [Metabacillus fastidiosus]
MHCEYCNTDITRQNLADRCDVRICTSCDVKIDRGNGVIADSSLYDSTKQAFLKMEFASAN